MKHSVPFTTSYTTKLPEYFRARGKIPTPWTYAVMRWFHQPAAGVMVSTATLHDELSERGFQNLVRWGRGVDLKLFRPQSKDFLSAPRPILMYVGRVAVEKNLEKFLRLDMPGTKYVVGDGPQLKYLTRKYPNARFVGDMQGEELARYYAAADVFVFPSRTDTFGLVLLEALASGVPVAAFPVAGPLDVVGNSGVGVLDEDLGAAVRKALQISPDRMPALRPAVWLACRDATVPGEFAADSPRCRGGWRPNSVGLAVGAPTVWQRCGRTAQAHAADDQTQNRNRRSSLAAFLSSPHGGTRREPIMEQFAVVVPYYNEASYIADTLASLLAQSHPISQLILVDNGSTDGSEADLPSRARQLRHPRGALSARASPGVIHALEHGARHVRTRVRGICRRRHVLSAPLPGDLRTAVSQRAKIAASASWRKTFAGRTTLGPAWPRAGSLPSLSKILSWHCFAGGAGQAFRTAAFRAAGGYSSARWNYVLQDHEIVNRIHKLGPTVYHPDHWCVPSPRRGDRTDVSWTKIEQLLYFLTPVFRPRLVFPSVSGSAVRRAANGPAQIARADLADDHAGGRKPAPRPERCSADQPINSPLWPCLPLVRLLP